MATVPPGGDPRLEAQPGSAPIVAPPRAGPSWVVIAIGMAILAVLLFGVLDARRRAVTAPTVRPTAADRAAGAAAAPPQLYIPPAPAPPPQQAQPQAAPPPAPAPVAPAPRIIYVPQPAPAPAPPVADLAPPPVASGPALVFERAATDSAASPAAAGEAAAPLANPASVAGERVRAGVLANRAETVSQGTLIPAVLETGLDSTRPGLARAMVTRDVRGFDGRRVLVPRGSRLIGEYRSDAAPGQKRMLVNWLRLIRPDGVTIAIGSPAGDPLGRGGVRARVNSHFFERFAGAILQSTLDVGVNLASGLGNAPVIVALPGTLQNSAQPITQGNQVTPTLTVRPGTSITIFVARDLDFTGAGTRR